MRDYWLTQYVLAAVGWGYVGLTVIALAIALWLPTGKTAKTLAALVVLALASILPVQGFKEYEQERQAANEFKQRYAKAKALFDERCKTAGEKIYRTVEGVEGVLLIKVRPDKINFSDQYAMDDPYGRDVGGDGYIRSFLRVTNGEDLNPRVAAGRKDGFKIVEALDTKDNRLYQYSGVIKSVLGRDPNFEFEKTPQLKRTTRFGVDYEDISTPTDRENWIAGGVIKVIDLETTEVVAERRGYIFDAGLGNTSGGRGPWEAASPCAGTTRNLGHNAQFVLKSLKPTSGK